MQHQRDTNHAGPDPAFLPLVEACRQHGIGRTKAFELAKAGAIETFLVGTRRYVTLASLRELPQRLRAETEAGEGGAK